MLSEEIHAKWIIAIGDCARLVDEAQITQSRVFGPNVLKHMLSTLIWILMEEASVNPREQENYSTERPERNWILIHF